MRFKNAILATVVYTLSVVSAHACAFINERCVSAVGEHAWLELPEPAKAYLLDRGIQVTGGVGVEPLRIVLSGYTFEIRPADARDAHVWLVEGDDPRDKVVVFVLESSTGVRQVCEVSSYETEHWSHQCHVSRSASERQATKK